MTSEVRRLHRRMITAMAFAVPALMIAALVTRPKTPVNDFRAGESLPSGAVVAAELDVMPAGLFRARILSAEHELWLQLERSGTLPHPDAGVYLMVNGAPVHIGRIDGRRVQMFRIPGRGQTTVFEVRSLAGHKVLASFVWSAEP